MKSPIPLTRKIIFIYLSCFFLKVFTLSSIVEAGNSSDTLQVKTVSAEPAQQKVIYVAKVNSTIKIDGIFDEPEWKESIPVSDFIQQEPQDNNPASEKTEVRVMRDDGNLYFAITCFDSEPDKIIGNEMKRDSHLDNNDNFEIFLDTFQDKKNCYSFRINPAGAKVDALITEEGKNINESWNTLWQCRTKKHEYGWTVEISIPLYALRFSGSIDNWGVNFGREIRRKNEKTYWSYIPRALMKSGKYRASLFGKMAGLENLSKGKNLDIVPYLKGATTKEYTLKNKSSNADGGFDLSYRITGNFKTDVSYKTDFAQVEADQEVVNVSRYDILFPEKREFFLDNAGLYQFGDMVLYESLSGGSGQRIQVSNSAISNSQSNYLLFYSRNIGLKGDMEIPLYGGTKISGKTGKNTFGFMSMQTMEKAFSSGVNMPSTNYSALRIKHDLLKNSNIGLIVLNKQSSPDVYNRSVGIDGNFPLTPSFTTGGSFAKTLTPNIKGKDYAGTFFMDLKKDFFSWNLKYLYLDDNFNPEMGYIRRNNIRSTYTTVMLQKWINNYGFRNIVLNTDLNYATDNRNVLNSKHLSERAYLQFSSGDRIIFGIDRDNEVLEENDYIKTVLIASGKYSFNTYQVSFSSDHSRKLAGTVEYKIGDYYGGKSRVLSPHYHFKPSSHFHIDTYYDYNHVVLPYGRFYSNVISNRITYMLNPDFYVKAFTQWNDLDKRLSTNILFHYIYNAANNFYLVYNENRDPDLPGRPLRDRVIMIKFSYHFFV